MARGLAVWLLIMAAETVHGVLRGLFLVPAVGEPLASRIGWPVGMAIVLGLTLLLVHWIGITSARSLIRLGAIWAGLTLLFEIGIGLLRGMNGAQIAGEINPIAGGLTIYSLVAMAAAPWLAARIRGLIRPS